jgi:lambda family phage tail tape measure protein
MQDAAVSWAENATNAFVDFVATGKASFSDLAESILRDILRIAMQKTFSPVLSGIGDALVKGLGSWLTSAHGNAFDAGRVVPFATGGIISKPVAFPLGLAGEAGPEAILPLSRMSGGDLGVKAGVGNVVVNVVEAPGKGGEVRQSTDGGQRIIEVMVERIKASIAGDVSRGLGSVPQAMERTYGLNRAAGAY